MDARAERPAAVTVIAWVFIVLSGMMTLSGFAGWFSYTFVIKEMTAKAQPVVPSDASIPTRIIRSLFQYFDVLALVQIAIAVLVLIAGIRFLKLRAWSRTVLEAFSWLALAAIIGFGTLWVAEWLGSASRRVPGSIPPMFDVVGVIMGIIFTLVWAVPFVVIIAFLRGKKIRGAVA